MTDPTDPSIPSGSSSLEPGDAASTPQLPDAASSTEPVPAASLSSRLKPPAFWRLAIVAACGVVLLVSAAFAIGASPAPSNSTTNPEQTNNGDQGNDHGSKFGFPGLLAPNGFVGPGPANGFGHRFGGPLGQITIAAINGNSLSLKTDDGWTRTISVGSSTTITKAGKTITVADLKVGDTIRFSETRQSDGSYSIDQIVVVVPTVAGTVTDVTTNGFTMKARDGTTWTITVDGSTAYRVGDASGSKSDVKSGVDVIVAGTKGSTDTSLTASTVVIRLPVVAGEVTAINGNAITIKRFDGTTQTIHVSGDTTYRVAGVDSAKLSDVKVGMQLLAQGAQRSDGSIDAVSVAAGNGRGLPGKGWFGPGRGHDKLNGASPNASTAPSTSGTQG
jgi:hypothetical protein